MKSIKEIADIMGCSVQAVYQRIEKDFKPFLKIENGRKYLDDGILRYIQPKDDSSMLENSFKLALNLIEKQNEQLSRELEIKNTQIEELNLRLAEAHQMASNAQRLHGADKVLELADEKGRTNFKNKKATLRQRAIFLIKGEL